MKIFRCVAVVLVALAAGAPGMLVGALRNATAVINVLAYNDVYEMLQDDVNGFKLGGPSRVVQIAKKVRSKNPNTLVLFAGDTMSPSLWSAQLKGMQMVDAHNAIGVDFASLGNHEFDYGIDAFLSVSRASNFPWLNANCYEISTQKLLRGTVPRAIKVFKSVSSSDVKIGIFGVMYDMKDPRKGLFWTDPIAAAKEQVKLLKAEGADIVIALTHQDLEDDNQFAKEVAGVTVIYGGHDHNSMLQTNFGTPYLKADLNFRSIWSSRIEYYANEGGLAAGTQMSHRALPIVEAMPSDPALDEVIANYAATIGALTSRVIGTLCEPLDVTKKSVRAKDVAVGAIFSDACLSFYGPNTADVSVNNGGGIRTDTTNPAGPITMGQVIAWSPFGNTLVVVETDGASLKKLVTKMMLPSCGDTSTLPNNGNYVHPGGFKFTFTCYAAKVGEITSIEWFKHPTRSGQLLATDVFKLAISNFLYNTEFLTISGATVNKVVVSEAEAGRIDTALEQYAKSFPDSRLCVKADGRSKVEFVKSY